MLTVLSLTGFFARFWHQLIIIFLSCVPIIESRYAIVIGDVFFKELGTTELFILSQLGAFSITLILLFLLRPVFNWMKSTRLFKNLVEKLTAKCVPCDDKSYLSLKNKLIRYGYSYDSVSSVLGEIK